MSKYNDTAPEAILFALVLKIILFIVGIWYVAMPAYDKLPEDFKNLVWVIIGMYIAF